MRTRMKIKDVMSKDVLTVRPDTPFKQVVERMEERHVSAVPVVDPTNRVVGIVSESDLLRKEGHHPGDRLRWYERRARRLARKARGRTAEEVMTSPVLTIRAYESVWHAASLMVAEDVNHLVVVDGTKRVVGIVARSDLLRTFLLSDAEIAANVKEGLVEDPYAISVDVEDGIVTLRGQLERRSMIEPTISHVRTFDGVVDVVDQLTFAKDDTERPLRTPEMTIG